MPLLCEHVCCWEVLCSISIVSDAWLVRHNRVFLTWTLTDPQACACTNRVCLLNRPRPHCPRSKLVSCWWSRRELTVIEVCMRQSFAKITLDLDSVDVTISSCLLLSRIDSQSLLPSLRFSACLWFWQVEPIWFSHTGKDTTDKCDNFFSLLSLIWNPKPRLFRWSEHPFELKCWDYFL